MTGIYVDDINESTSAHGVEIDGVSLKDGQVPASAGGSLVYLAKYTADSSVEYTYFNLSSYTTFTTYKLIFENLLPDVDGNVLHIRVGTTTSPITSGYYSQQVTWRGKGTGSVTDGHSVNADVLFYLGSAIGTATGEQGVCGEAFITAPLSSSYFTCGGGDTIFMKSDDNLYRQFNSGVYKTAISTPYIFLSTNSSQDIESGSIVLYGVKNA